MKKELQCLENEINDFTDYFVKRYFDERPTDLYWAGDIVGGVLCANDYFFNLDTMMDFVRYNYSVKLMFEYMDYELIQGLKTEPIINIKNYKQWRDKKYGKPKAMPNM